MSIKNIKQLPSQEYLKECFDYDQETGTLTWKERPLYHFTNESKFKKWNALFIGKSAGVSSNVYIDIKIQNKESYLAHRIIWKWMTGEDPLEQIDHIDGNRFNNAWNNLREASHKQNQHNRSKNKNNKCGFKGVRYMPHLDKYSASITINRKWVHIGTYNTSEEAYENYCKVAKAYQNEFFRNEIMGQCVSNNFDLEEFLKSKNICNNSSGYKGINYNKRSNKYVSRKSVNGKDNFLGYFDTAEEAYKIYCEFCEKLNINK